MIATETDTSLHSKPFSIGMKRLPLAFGPGASPSPFEALSTSGGHLGVATVPIDSISAIR